MSGQRRKRQRVDDDGREEDGGGRSETIGSLVQQLTSFIDHNPVAHHESYERFKLVLLEVCNRRENGYFHTRSRQAALKTIINYAMHNATLLHVSDPAYIEKVHDLFNEIFPDEAHNREAAKLQAETARYFQELQATKQLVEHNKKIQRDLEAALTEAQLEREKLTAENSRAIEQIQILAKQSDSKNAHRISELLEIVKQRELLIQTHNEKIAASEQELRKIQTTLQEKERQISILGEQVISLQRQNVEQQQSIDALTDNIQQFQHATQQAREQISELQTNLKGMVAEKTQLEQTITQLQSKQQQLILCNIIRVTKTQCVIKI